jgi:hypothetical protein
MGGAMSTARLETGRFNQRLILGLSERYYPQTTQITQITVWGARRQEDKEAFLNRTIFFRLMTQPSPKPKSA